MAGPARKSALNLAKSRITPIDVMSRSTPTMAVSPHVTHVVPGRHATKLAMSKVLDDISSSKSRESLPDAVAIDDIPMAGKATGATPKGVPPRPRLNRLGESRSTRNIRGRSSRFLRHIVSSDQGIQSADESAHTLNIHDDVPIPFLESRSPSQRQLRTLRPRQSVRGKSFKNLASTAVSEVSSTRSVTVSRATRSKLQGILNHKAVTLLSVALTVFALFGEDFKLAVTPTITDDAFGAITVLTIAVFVAEFTLNCVARRRYIGATYFYLDLVCTVSMIADLPW